MARQQCHLGARRTARRGATRECPQAPPRRGCNRRQRRQQFASPSKAGRPVWVCWRSLISIPLGAVVPVVVLWIIPARLTFLYLLFFFVWLPHFPYEHTDRFRNTRITLFPGSTWLLLQQDRHLIHHLYPSIPWYRYRAAHRELAPLLSEQRAVVAGPSSDPRVRVRLR